MFKLENFVSVPFRSLTTSLFITIINASIELAFLSAMLVMIAANECRKLRKGEAINIRRHCFSVRLVTVTAMIMFIVLEILISINSKAGHSMTTKEDACISTREGMVSLNDSSASEAITMRCMNVNGDVFSFRNGNYSKDNGMIRCENDTSFVYKYTAKDLVADDPLSNAVTKCISTKCVAVKSRGNSLLISVPYEESSGSMANKNNSFMLTTVMFDPKPMIEDVADRVAELYQLQITDELQIRRLALLRAIDSDCDVMVMEHQVTEISTWIAAITIIVWILSILLIFSAIIVKRHIFYDINRIRDWAEKTYNVPGRDSGDEFYIKTGLEGDIHRLYVTNSLKDNLSDMEMSLESEDYGPMFKGIH